MYLTNHFYLCFDLIKQNKHVIQAIKFNLLIVEFDSSERNIKNLN